MLTNNPEFESFIADMRQLIAECGDDESLLLERGQQRLAQLVASDGWLPAEYSEADDKGFKQYILHREEPNGFSVIAVVWAPGQYATPHDHMMWGMFGQLRGSEKTNIYDPPIAGRPMTIRETKVLKPGETGFVSPRSGDIHDVENVHSGNSVSIHVYGGDLEAMLGSRHHYRAGTGEAVPFQARYH